MKKSLAMIMLSAAVLSSCGGNTNGNLNENTAGENEVIAAIMGRRSIRKYQDKAVPRELLEKVAVCGINAPNARNAQNWEVRIVDSPEFIDGVTKVFLKEAPEAAARNSYFKNVFRNAPAIICIAGAEGRFTDVDCGLMGENMLLAAYSLGLGTCVLGGPVDILMNNPEARPFYDALQFSEGYSLRYIIAIGYPEEAPEARSRDASKIRFVDFK